MAAKLSTGLRNSMLNTTGLKSALAPMQMRLYSGTVPADADASIGAAVLLCTITDDAGADELDFDTAPSAGVLAKAPAQIWRGVNAASGLCSFYRLVEETDAGGSSTTAPRIQGTVAAAGADLNLSNPTLTAAASQTIDYYTVALPTA